MRLSVHEVGSALALRPLRLTLQRLEPLSSLISFMCHILLVLPLLALPVFWVWPLPVALPIYGAAVGLAAVTYWCAACAMRQPRKNGAESLIGDTGQVVVSEFGEVRIQIRNELWEPVSAVPLHQGDHVKVVAAERTRLRVQKLNANAALVTGSGITPKAV